MRDLAIQMARKIHILKMVTLAVKDLFSAFKSLTQRFTAEQMILAARTPCPDEISYELHSSVMQ